MERYVLDEKFLESIKQSGNKPRQKGGVNTQEVSVLMAQTQLVNDTNTKLDKIIELLEKSLETSSKTVDATPTNTVATSAESTKTVVPKPVTTK